MIRVAIGIIAFLFSSGVVLAQGPAPLNEDARAMLGPWEFSNAGRENICTATFKSDAVAAGYKVEFDANCATYFPLVAGISAWKYPDNDLLYLLDAGGRVLAEFSEVEDGIFEAPTPGAGVLFLQSPAAAGPAPRTAAEVAGAWAIRRGDGAVLCRLVLSAAAVKDGLALTVQPGCDAAIAGLAFTRWQLDRGELVLVPARGNAWRFEAAADNAWARLPEAANRMMLVRE